MDFIILYLHLVGVPNMQTFEPVVLQGMTKDDIERIFDDCMAQYRGKMVKVILLDATYGYSFAPKDVPFVTKVCNLGRTNELAVLDWHRMNERWYADQTVIDDFGREIKPLFIRRTIDKVPNEGLKVLMGAGYVGREGKIMSWHGFGSGPITRAFASDQILVSEIERIDVTDTPGGSVNVIDTTFYQVANHTIDMPDDAGSEIDVTESAVLSSGNLTTDKMGDHSYYSAGIPHNQGEDAQGATTVIYPCSV